MSGRMADVCGDGKGGISGGEVVVGGPEEASGGMVTIRRRRGR
jgi:hypothetical protein